MNRQSAFIGPLLGLFIGCSATGSPRALVVGNDGTGGAGSSGGTGGSGPIQVEDASSTALSAHVESPPGMTVSFVTLSCSKECADVLVVAKGGFAPYTYTWQDGSKAQRRELCPTATTDYHVTVADSGSSSVEFSRPPTTVTVPFTANVKRCPADGGVGDAGGNPSGLICLANPSFEGVVTPTQLQAFDAPPWNACYAGGFITYSAIGDPSLWPSQNWTFPVASDGKTYLALGQQGPLTGRASQVLCEPIRAGESRSFFVDLASGTASGEAPSQVMQILGGSDPCTEPDVLWTSPQLSASWATYCVTLRPSSDVKSLGFRPLATGGLEMEGLVDHVVPVAACP